MVSSSSGLFGGLARVGPGKVVPRKVVPLVVLRAREQK
jgi:hypothetical protein